jgi:hypothetical protein
MLRVQTSAAIQKAFRIVVSLRNRVERGEKLAGDLRQKEYELARLVRQALREQGV